MMNPHTSRIPYRSAVLFAALAFTTTASAQNAKRPVTITDMLTLRSPGGVAVSPDGQSVVYSVSEWDHPGAGAASKDVKDGKDDAAGLADKPPARESHIWLVPSAGGTPRQITFGEKSESSPQWSPDGRTIAFLTSRGPVDKNAAGRQIFLLLLKGGEASQLTKARDGVGAYVWSPDGSKIAYISSDSTSRADEAKRSRHDDAQVFEGDHKMSHVWVIDVPTRKTTEVAHGDFTVRGTPSWSPDGTRLAFGASPTPMIRDLRGAIYIVNLADNQVEQVALAPHSPTNGPGQPIWSPDGTTLAYTTDPQGSKVYGDGIMEGQLGYSHLILYNVATKQSKDTYDPRFDFNVRPDSWTPDGRGILVTADDHAYNSVFRYDVAANKYTRLTVDMLVSGISVNKDGSRVAFTMQTSTSPSDVYVSDLTFQSPKKITNVNPQVANFELGQSEVIKWKSTDGWPVEGILLKPVGYQPGKKYPLLVEVHGGPTGANSNGFHPEQFWAGKGWAVLYPNPRGSTGYGQKFMQGNIEDWGGGDYRDIMTGVDEVIRRGIADSTKMALMGWSYGGYMSAWVVTQTSRFKAIRMGAGLSDLVSMTNTTDIPDYLKLFFKGMPSADNLALYRKHSPITYVDQVTTPLLILHGGEDTRVPIGQPMEFYRALKDRGKTVELVFYPREGHGFSEYYHQLDRDQRQYDWISKYTLGADAQ